MIYSRTDFDEKMKNVCSILNNILDVVFFYVEQRFQTMGEFSFVEFLNPKLFRAFQRKHFELWIYIKTFWIETD